MKETANYSHHPHVITGAPQPVVTRHHLTRHQYAAQYGPLSEVEAPIGSIIELVFTDGDRTGMQVILPDAPVVQGGLHEAAE